MSQSDKKLWKIALACGAVVLVLLVLWPSPKPKPTPVMPTAAQLDAARGDMAEWAEGRWSAWHVRWDGQQKRALMGVTADPLANSVAIDGYCRIMREVASEHLGEFDMSAVVERPNTSNGKIDTFTCAGR